MTYIRCHSCRLLFPKENKACPDCGAPKRPVNVALASQAWRTNLNWHAQHADEHT